MILEKVNKNQDLKKLSTKEKKILSEEIREYIISTVSKTGGHLASNLGVVELTIALESIFNVNKDKIIWDVGHQCYTHKILNGRKNEMKTLRKLNGISGFPKKNESISDCFNTGHSSTSISAGMGIAKARDIKNKNYNVISVIGDGALTGGMAMEALNHVGSTKTRLIIILNDNEMSISENIGGINELLTKLRTKKNYRKTNEYSKKIIKSIPFIGKSMVLLISKIKGSIKKLIIPGMYFEEIGIKYLGPVDGHNIDDLESIFRKAKEFKEPVLIHVLTKKGKGYKYAEENPSKFHGVGSFDITTGKPFSNKRKDYSKVFGEKLVLMAGKNKKIVAITAAMRDGVGLNDFSQKYKDRFFDVGIAEQHALTLAAGLASEGMIPFVSIYSSFYQRAYDQIIHDICTQNLPVIMCVDRAGIVGNDGETHQGIYDMSFFKIIPNITIMAPKNFDELEKMMDFAVKINKPVVIRYPRGSESKIDLKTTNPIIYGKSEVLTKGNDLTILGIGKTVSTAYEIALRLEEINIHSDVINIRFLKPIDSKTVINSLRKTESVIILEDNTKIGGLTTSIKELIIDNNIKISNFKSYSYPDEFIPHGSIEELEKKYKLDIDTIIKDIQKMMR